MKRIILFIAGIAAVNFCYGQADTVFVQPAKVRHAEPLYMDLVRDLGARKGEREWNLGWGLAEDGDFLRHSGFIEYEFAPVNRLGLEVEVPITFYSPFRQREDSTASPRDRIEGLKIASQYTFFVSQQYQLSMAVGYMHEFRFHSFQSMRSRRVVLKGHRSDPFFVVAKRWGAHIHTLLYMGPEWEYTQGEKTGGADFPVNVSIHYMFPHTRNFVGVEVNREFDNGVGRMFIHPQVKFAVSSNVAVGVVTGLPLGHGGDRVSGMIRLVYEPRRR